MCVNLRLPDQKPSRDCLTFGEWIKRWVWHLLWGKR